uniref:Uncharacterized protein n=1 Tax=Kalanchoe fedtschenkoi TaxID=63787 RepID=A0A7N0UF53_KALFE
MVSKLLPGKVRLNCLSSMLAKHGGMTWMQIHARWYLDGQLCISIDHQIERKLPVIVSMGNEAPVTMSTILYLRQFLSNYKEGR